MEILTTREWATVIWAFILFVYAMVHRQIREAFWNVVKIFFGKKLRILWGIIFLYVLGITLIFYHKPTSGSLTYDGKDIYRFNDKELSAFRRQRIGFIFQQFNLLPVLTAKENIIMPLLLDKKQPDEAYLNQLTDLLGIRERLTHLPYELSGGQQQRVAIARALIAKPDIIFADEPTGNLDSRTSSDVLGLLKVTSQSFHQTIVMITHNNEIAQLADRIIRIEDGRISE